MVQIQHLKLCLNQVQGLSLTVSVKVVFAVVRMVEAEQASCSSAEVRLEETGCLEGLPVVIAMLLRGCYY